MGEVEFTAKYTTVVDDLTEAWTFVMQHLPLVGVSPNIHILSKLDSSGGKNLDEDGWGRVFEVVVEGTMTEAEAKERDS